MPSDRSSLKALRNILTEVDLILETTPLPENRTGRSRELLRAALAFTDDLMRQTKESPAAIMGHKGGSTTAQRGSEYMRQLAAKRKTRAGGSDLPPIVLPIVTEKAHSEHDHEGARNRGEKCEKLMGRIVVNVPVRDVECDDIWAFVAKKEGRKRPEEQHDESIGHA